MRSLELDLALESSGTFLASVSSLPFFPLFGPQTAVFANVENQDFFLVLTLDCFGVLFCLFCAFFHNGLVVFNDLE